MIIIIIFSQMAARIFMLEDGSIFKFPILFLFLAKTVSWKFWSLVMKIVCSKLSFDEITIFWKMFSTAVGSVVMVQGDDPDWHWIAF